MTNTNRKIEFRSFFTTLYFLILPFQTRWIYRLSPIHPDLEFGRLSLYAGEIILGILMVMAVTHGIKQHKIKRQKFSKDNMWLYAALAAVGYIYMRAAFSFDPSVGMQQSLWVLQGLVVVLLLVGGFMPKKAALNGFFVGVSLTALLGIFQSVTQSVFANKWLGLAAHNPAEGGAAVIEYGATRWLRAYGTFSHPNMLGGYMVLGGLLAAISFNKQKTKVFKVLLVLCSLALALSFSRSAWIAWAIGLSLFYIQKLVSKKTALLAVIAFVIPLLILWPATKTRLLGVQRLEERSVVERTTSIENGIEVFKVHPWFGVGPGHYIISTATTEQVEQWWQLAPPHNVFVLLLAELGIVGFVLIGIVFVVLYRTTRKKVFIVASLPLLPLLLLDHYLFSYYTGVIMLAVYLALFSLLYTDSPQKLHG